MSADQFQLLLPNIVQWIDDTVSAHRLQGRPVASFGFRRLQHFYSPEMLSATRVVIVDQVPVPPLTAMGLESLSDFERMDSKGITYGDTYFLRRNSASDEALHFHEIVHVAQWRLLGVQQFIMAYALALRDGYESNPFEVMAYEFEDRFSSGGGPFKVERKRRQGSIR